MISRSLPTSTAAAALAACVAWAGAHAQVVEGPIDTTTVRADSSDLLSVGMAAQALFERRRLRFLPVTLESGSGACDEHVGRFCTWYGEGEWYPTPEHPEIIELRGELLDQLGALQEQLPGEGWLLGQRVWYHSEGGAWVAALESARGCGTVERWWCLALEGFSLHGLGRYREAEATFEEALAEMEPWRAEEWRRPERALDSDGRDALQKTEELPPDSTAALLRRLWSLADPLYLVDGNDRLTAHYARWTVATLRERVRNPFRIRWGHDLETLTVRHGWEMGWERSPTRIYSTQDNVIGHKHPEGRDYMPPGDALMDPALATAEDLVPGRRRPRSLHAPAYAPVLLPMEGQLAIFPRGPETVIVSTHFLPPDTTFHADHRHELPWLDPGDQAGMADRIGLFALATDDMVTRRRSLGRGNTGALRITVPTGSYVVSAETWSPSRRRAGRLRLGVPARVAPDDIATLSDLLLLRPMDEEPVVLEAALDAALPRARILPGQTFAIAWEVTGLGFRPETLRYEVSVEREGVNVLRRFGQFLRLADRPQPLALSWEEPGPERPTYDFRYLDLDLPALDPGAYRIRLVLRTANRSEAETTTTFEVRERDRSQDP